MNLLSLFSSDLQLYEHKNVPRNNDTNLYVLNYFMCLFTL